MNKNKTLILLLLFIILIGGVIGYLLLTKGYNLPKEAKFNNEVVQIQSQSYSDEVLAIEEDLNKTDYTDIDRDLDTLDKEFNSSY